MKKLISNSNEVLSRNQLKNILGGTEGTCKAYVYQGPFKVIVSESVCKEEAMEQATFLAVTYGNGHWCCDNC